MAVAVTPRFEGEESLPKGAALQEELVLVERKLAKLQRERSSKVAELTRLAEALSSARQRCEEAQAEGASLARNAKSSSSRRVQAEDSLRVTSKRLAEIRAQCVELQAATPEPKDVGDIQPEAQVWVDRAAASQGMLEESRQLLQQRQLQKVHLENLCAAEANDLESMRSKVATLEEVYEHADERIQELEASSTTGEVDSEATVFALAGIVLPLVNFRRACEVVTQLHLMSRSQRPVLMPQLNEQASNQVASFANVGQQPALIPQSPAIGSFAKQPRAAPLVPMRADKRLAVV